MKKLSLSGLIVYLTLLPNLSFSQTNPTVVGWQAKAHWGAVSSVKLQDLFTSTTGTPWSYVTGSAIIFPMYSSAGGGSTIRANTLYSNRVTGLEGEAGTSLTDAFTSQKSARVENLFVNAKLVKLSPPSPIDLIMTGGNLDPAKIAAFGMGYDYVIVDLANQGFCGVNLSALAYQTLMQQQPQQLQQQ